MKLNSPPALLIMHSKKDLNALSEMKSKSGVTPTTKTLVLTELTQIILILKKKTSFSYLIF